MANEIKAILHNHPHFYGPCKIDSETNMPEWSAGEWMYSLYNQAPNIRGIIEYSFKKNIDILTLSGCQAHKRDVDKSIQNYFNQLSALKKDFEIEYHLDEGFANLFKRSSGKKMVLISGCEIRTDHQGRTADINVIGIHPGTYIEPGENIDETVKKAKDLGALVTVCHPNSANGCGIDKAFGLYNKGLVHGIEGFNAMASETENEELGEALKEKGMKILAVPDSHHYTDVNIAYSIFPKELLENFSREKLIENVQQKNFEGILNQLSFSRRFKTHLLPMGLSVPMNLIKNPRYFIKFLKSSIFPKKDEPKIYN